ncbi:MMPL family transporter [Terrihabitans rhizophilus]|uniref:MMPL family transporter n=1 Tax=Terrihabitans rhizophilus TaxID=3092662 RepID=A0ABU4RK89_9HYPH|nr:MMPL family transporter [Terrihabitans sp. PJ23]MDX6804459.1 MMPL family transporter [Terrihabitans sp. PJ23]
MNKTSERIFTRCAEICTRHRWTVVIISVVLTALAAYASTFMTVNTSTDGVLSNSLRFRQVEEQYRKSFPKEEAILAIVDAATPADADSAAQNLAVRLRARPELFSDVRQPGTQPFFTQNGLLYLPEEQLNGLLQPIENAAGPLQLFAADASLRSLAQMIADPQGGSGQADSAEAARLFRELGTTASARASGDQDKQANWVDVFGIKRPEGRPGTRRFVLTKPVLDNASMDRGGPAIEALHEEIAGLKGEEAKGVEVQITGDPVLRRQELHDAFAGASTASVLSLILVAISLVLGVRSGRLIFVLMVTLLLGGILTTGLAALVVGRLNLISIAFMVLFIGLGVDFGTHLGLRFMEEHKKGLPFEKAMGNAMVGEGPAIGLSTLCAIVAFLSFVPTSYTGLAEFGIISALGMVVAFITTFTLQPALMALLPPKTPKKRMPEFGIGNWIRLHHMGILIVAGVVTLAGLYAASFARVDTNPLNLQDPRAEPVVAYRSLADNPQTSPYSINVVAKDVETARQERSKLAALPGVAHVMTAEDFLPTGQEPKLALVTATKSALGPAFFNPQVAPAPDEAELRAAFLQLREASSRIVDSAPEGSDIRAAATSFRDGLAEFEQKRGTDAAALADLQKGLIGSLPQIVSNLRERLADLKPLAVTDLPPDVRRDWINDAGEFRLQVQPAGNVASPEGFETFSQTVQSVAPDASGVPISVHEAGEAITISFGEAILYTTLAIGLIVIALRRRVSDVVLVLAPLAVASIWTVACSALLDLPFNFANVIVIPLLIGLGVAGSIHIVVRARELEHERTETGEIPDVLDTSTSLAVLVAQLNTVAAFATLIVSHHRGLYSMGMLLGLSILLVVIVSLVVLPAALIAINRWKHRRHAGAQA